jgi:hypothetical protein
LTIVVHHVVDVVEEAKDFNDVHKVEVSELFLDIVEVLGAVFSEAFVLDLVVVVLVEASSPSLNSATNALNCKVHFPHLFFNLDLLRALWSAVAEDPFLLLVLIVMSVLLLSWLVNIWAISGGYRGQCKDACYDLKSFHFVVNLINKV